MKQIYFSLLLAIQLTCVHAEASLKTQIDALLEKNVPHASVGIIIKNAKTDAVLYNKNPGLFLMPASNAKLFTAVAALTEFKPETTFATSLYEKDHSIFVTFDGSPSLTIAQFNELLANLKKNNINEIKGNFVIDSSLFSPPYYPKGTSFDDQGWYYAAPETAVILNGNAENYLLTTNSKLGGLVTIKPKKPNPKLHLINEVTTASKEDAKKNCSLNVESQNNNTLRLFGCVAQRKNAQELQLAVPDPSLLAKVIIEHYLKQNQIHLAGEIINGKRPKDAKLIATVPSANIIKLVKHMLQESDNLYAGTLVRQLGYATSNKAQPQNGMNAINKILADQFQLDMSQVKLDDGIGTRYNLVTPEQIMLLLTKIYHNPQLFPLMLESLPQSGVSGTLKARMQKTSLEHIVYAKTGTMHDVSSLSGYLITPGKDPLIFTIVINGITKPIAQAKHLEEAILLLANNR